MSIKITQEDFVGKMLEMHPNIEVLGKYTKAKTPIKFRCKIHNYEFISTPDAMNKNVHGCKLCAIDYVAKCRRKSNNKFLTELEENNPNTEALEEYKISTKKIKVRCKTCGYEWMSTPDSLIHGNGCKKCAMKYVQNIRIKSHEQFLNEFNERNINHDTIDILSEYVKDYEPVICKCKICGNVWNANPHNLINKRSPSGCPLCNTSKGEKRIKNFLEDNDINYVWQKSFSDLIGTGGGLLSYDFYLPDNNILIEYQGEFHDGTANSQTDEQFEYQKEHDRRKRKYADDNKIQLLEIWYKDFNNIEQILKDNLAA